MTAQPAEAVQLLGRAQSGDPVAATARSLGAVLARHGRASRLAAVDRTGAPADVEAHDVSGRGALVVHTVDGGESLASAAASLVGRRLTLVHHGSAPGSDRGTLRALRGATSCAVAADPAAREELRALGFGAVKVLDPRVADEAMSGLTADDATTTALDRHPGPRLLSVGPIGPGRGLEVLLDAFAGLLTHDHPSAVLSLCGPSTRWYRTQLHRRIVTSGLFACEVVEPGHDGEVLARLLRADAVVSVRPQALDPYLRFAARHGVPVVAPASAATSSLAPSSLVATSGSPSGAELRAALATALDRPRAETTRPPEVWDPGPALADLGLA